MIYGSPVYCGSKVMSKTKFLEKNDKLQGQGHYDEKI